MCYAVTGGDNNVKRTLVVRILNYRVRELRGSQVYVSLDIVRTKITVFQTCGNFKLKSGIFKAANCARYLKFLRLLGMR